MTSGKPLTPQQQEEILCRRDEFPSVVAKDLGISRWAVMNVLKKDASSLLKPLKP